MHETCRVLKVQKKRINLDSLSMDCDYFLHDVRRNVKNSPFVCCEEGSFLVINTFKVRNYDAFQMIIDVRSAQAYYRYCNFGKKTNWISVALIDCKKHSMKKTLEELFELASSKDRAFTFVNSVAQLVLDLKNDLDLGLIKTVLDNDFEAYQKYKNKCLVSFVDDDSGYYIDDIWKDTCEKKGIKIGFACITGFMSGEVPANNNAYKQTSLESLKDYYSRGFDVYSHSFSHRFFYEVRNNKKTINNECLLSKSFILENGFCRGSDIIVYPGGLGYQRIQKKRVISKYFRYGVDTVGKGINQEPFDRYCIHRLNLDVTSLDDIEKKIDEAAASNSFLVFMSHSYELNKDKDNQLKKIESVISYLEEKKIPIMPLSLVLKIKDYYEDCSIAQKPFSFKLFLKELLSDLRSLFSK